MTCRDWELQIADGNLSAEAATHLPTCAECQALQIELRENAAALAAMREQEWVEQASACSGGFRRRRARTWVAPAAAAVILALALASIWHPNPAPEKLAFSLPAPPAPPVLVMRQAKPSLPKPSPAPVHEEQLLVKMLTPDPDVVVYWIVDNIADNKEKAE